MGKEELNNIKKMYLLRMHTNKKYAIIVFCVAIVFALVDILSMVINFSTDKDVFYLNLNRNSGALFWIVILVLVITSFNIGEYKNNYMVFPQNSVTRYVSAYLADVTTFGIASLFQVMNQLILFGVVSLVSLFNKNIKLIFSKNHKIINIYPTAFQCILALSILQLKPSPKDNFSSIFEKTVLISTFAKHYLLFL